jgi:hypothetical protein
MIRQLSLPVFSLLLLPPFAGCGSRPDKQEKPEATAPQGNQENAGASGGQEGQASQGGRGRGAKSHLTFAGSLQSEGDFALDCNLGADKTLQITFDPAEGAEGPQVQVRIAGVNAEGEYPATVTIHEQPASGAARDWTGNAKVQLKSHVFGGARKRSGYNGSLSGTFQGPGGSGTLNGNFRRCMVATQ